jgi:hypothetical protein
MLNLSNKATVDFDLGPGAVIRFDLLRPLYDEGPQIIAVVMEHFMTTRKLSDGLLPEDVDEDKLPDLDKWKIIADRARVVSEAAKSIPRALVSTIFERYVTNVRDGQNEAVLVDGITITDGPSLLKIADLRLVRYVVDNLYNMCRLTVEEGKGSDSPSTLPTATSSSGESTAPSTDVSTSIEDGTATGILDGSELSIDQASETTENP